MLLKIRQILPAGPVFLPYFAETHSEMRSYSALVSTFRDNNSDA